MVKKNNRIDNYFLACTNYKKDGTGCGRTISQSQYAYWNSNEFGVEDPSASLPSYTQATSPQEELRPPARTQTKAWTKGHANRVFETTTLSYQLGGYTFEVIADDKGNVITNLRLLQEMHQWRTEMAMRFGCKTTVILSNRHLVELASHLPTSKQELIEIYGVGPRRVARFGDQIIEIIARFCQQPDAD